MRQPATPWPAGELSRILASARSMPDMVGGVQAAYWWPVFILTALDTGSSISDALAANRNAYDRESGTLAVGPYVVRLHPLTINALDALPTHADARLLPWPFDNGRPPFYMLYRNYRHVLYRAGLPYTSTSNLFERLRVTGEQAPGILNHVDLSMPFDPVPGKPSLPRARDLRRRSRPQKVSPRVNSYSDLVASGKAEGTLRQFFEETYLPLRLEARGAAAATPGGYRTAISGLCRFARREVKLANLNDDFLERFGAWLIAEGLGPVTVNTYTRSLLTLWRYAWRKRLVEELPRDVDKLPVDKRLPEAWTVEEVGRILSVAAALKGEVCGVSESLFWCGSVLVLYETGIRRRALLGLRSEHLNLEAGTLFVPAGIQKQKTDAVFELHSETLKLLAESQPDRRERLFPWRHAVKTFVRRYKKLLIAAGLPHGPRDLIHKLRRTSGTHVAAATDERTAQEHLGHSDIGQTRLYLDPRMIPRRTSVPSLLPRPTWTRPNLSPLQETK